MTPETVSLINLPYWETGRRRIRFLYLVGESSFQVTKPSTDQEQTTPLFLGADLFSNTDVRVENHPRYHSKFAKKGLATKLVFSSEFRFQGLRVPWSSNGLWFYSVDGIFRVTFELHNKHDQLSILETFQDLWKSRIDDVQLNPSYNVTAQLALQPPNPGDLEVPSVAAAPPEPREGGPESQETGEHLRVKPADHDYCSVSEQADSRRAGQLATMLCDLGDKVRRASLDPEQERTAVKLLDHLRRWTDGRPDEDALAETVMTLLQTHSRRLCVYSSALLRTVAGWLGRQFHQANGSVSRQVEGFKLRHIEHIRDLPPAEDLATELFPEAMRNLLVHWMGFSEESGAWKRRSEYPIVLLILEFANHNLITGVAHVLYSSLICKDTPRY
ncbi:uncharacterized protein si:ch211-110p13.9 [Trichomycterus rosablanca]|uniref:uncharacterized protein si:ch211-110p13.9 n=1 Tax=Trichomycterus rosablanca TaxID=2290929 RepID=UPI002F354905